MSTIVPSKALALNNISRFKIELESSAELQRRLAFARAWYATKDSQQQWAFAPSKFCGYEGMTAVEYVNDDPRDGRRTEKQLQRWFTTVPEEQPIHAELYEKLTSFLAKYNKPPSSAIRINVTNEFYEEHVLGSRDVRAGSIVDLIIAVALGLSDADRTRIKASI